MHESFYQTVSYSGLDRFVRIIPENITARCSSTVFVMFTGWKACTFKLYQANTCT